MARNQMSATNQNAKQAWKVIKLMTFKYANCGFKNRTSQPEASLSRAEKKVVKIKASFEAFRKGAKISKCVRSKTTIAIMGKCMCVTSNMKICGEVELRVQQ